MIHNVAHEDEDENRSTEEALLVFIKLGGSMITDKAVSQGGCCILYSSSTPQRFVR